MTSVVTPPGPAAPSEPARPTPRRWGRSVSIAALCLALGGGVGFYVGQQRTVGSCEGALNDGMWTSQQAVAANQALTQGMVDDAGYDLGQVAQAAERMAQRRQQCKADHP